MLPNCGRCERRFVLRGCTFLFFRSLFRVFHTAERRTIAEPVPAGHLLRRRADSFPQKCECNIQELGLLLFIYSIYCRGLPSCLPYGWAFTSERPTNIFHQPEWKKLVCLKLKYLLFSFCFSCFQCLHICLYCCDVILFSWYKTPNGVFIWTPTSNMHSHIGWWKSH